MFIYLLIG